MSNHDHKHKHKHEHEHEHKHNNTDFRAFMANVFSRHDHNATASIDSALMATAKKIHALKISLADLAITAAFQLIVILMSGSMALLNDTIHNFSNALTAVPLSIAFLLSQRQPTTRYTYGYKRTENVAKIFVMAMITLSAAIAA